MDANALQLNQYNVRQAVRFDSRGTVHHDYLVTFMLGEHGPFSLTYPDKLPEHSVLQADIGNLAQSIRAGANIQV